MKREKINYGMAVLGVIFLSVLYLLVHDEIQQYDEIVDHRVSVNEYVRKNKHKLDDENIDELYLECEHELEELRQKSKLGKIMVDTDREFGKIGCYIIGTAFQMMAICTILIIVIDLFMQIKRKFSKKE